MNCQNTKPDYVKTLNEIRKYPWILINTFHAIQNLDMKAIDMFMSSVIQSSLSFKITNLGLTYGMDFIVRKYPLLGKYKSRGY